MTRTLPRPARSRPARRLVPATTTAVTVVALAVAPLGPVSSAAAAPAVDPSLAPGAVRVWTTDLAAGQHLARGADLSWSTGPVTGADAGTVITVDPTRRYQRMTGFGAAMTESSAIVLGRLPEETRRSVMTDLFSPRQGIGLSFLRNPMGASDFATDSYSYDDQPARQTDPRLRDFSIARDEQAVIPRLREARRINPGLTLMGTPWSPPGWMKTSDSMVTGTLLPQYAKTYARYFVKYLEAYRAAGLPVQYVSAQNEPLYEPATYPGMSFTADQEAAFIGRDLGPALARAGLGTKILGYDHNWDVPAYPEQLQADRRAARYVPGTAWHCYGGDVGAQSVAHNDYPRAQAFETECSGGTWQGTDTQAFAATMQTLIGVPRNWGQSVVLWNVALDDRRGPQNHGCDTCRGLVTVHDDGTVTKELDYWALAQASRFVRPGAVRIASSEPVPPAGSTGLSDVAFTNPDGSQAVIVFNGGTTAADLTLRVGGRHVSTSLAAGAAATYTFRAPAGVRPAGDARLGWTDLDLGRAPAGTPTGRYTLSVGPALLDQLDQVRVGDRWLVMSRPYGSQLVAPASTALSRTGWQVTASASDPDSPVANLLDGDLSTRWSSGTGQVPGMSLTVDLGAARTFSQLVLDSGTSVGDYLRGYELQTSPDGSAWTTVARGQGTGPVTTVALPRTTARYLRIVSTESSGSWWSVAELNLREASGTVRQTSRGTLRRDSARLPDGTRVQAALNAGRSTARVAIPVAGFDYRYTLPAGAAVTFAERPVTG